jgi:hypothetical protein
MCNKACEYLLLHALLHKFLKMYAVWKIDRKEVVIPYVRNLKLEGLPLMLRIPLIQGNL